jgi:glycosyltransferase involved in cell wall biosynthesis
METASATDTRVASPMVSVIIPCYRQAKYLSEAVRSLVDQAYQRWECIIVNDGSPDDTREIAAELVRHDSRIRYIEQQNCGVACARNRGLAEIRGEYVVFLDADDLLLPTAFEIQLEAAANAGDCCVVISDYWLMDESGRRFENAMCTPEFRLSTPVHDIALRWETELSIPPHAFMFDARLFQEHGVRFTKALPNHEDWDCWMRVFMLRPIVRRVRERLAVYRVLPGSMSRDEERMCRGFRQAIDLQLERCVADAALRRMLVYKRRLTDDFYGKSLRVRVLAKLRRSQWFAKVVPQLFQHSLYQRLDLRNLEAHGWF